MILSASEIETTLRLAAVGSSWPFGLAEEIGRAGAWLVLQGLDGVGAAIEAVEEGAAGPLPAEKTAGGWLVGGERGPASAVAALDLAMAADEGKSVRLRGYRHPSLLIGLAGVAAKAFGCGFALSFDGDVRADVSSDRLQLERLLPEGPCDVVIARRQLVQVHGGGTLPDGIEVDDAIWRKAKGMAAKTYVPASEASRVRGAGAGLLDND